MHGTTLTLHIHRHITEDGSILLDVGKRIFRLYEHPASLWNIAVAGSAGVFWYRRPQISFA